MSMPYQLVISILIKISKWADKWLVTMNPVKSLDLLKNTTVCPMSPAIHLLSHCLLLYIDILLGVYSQLDLI